MKALFQRKGNTIIDLSKDKSDSSRAKGFVYINEAKRESRKLQESNGGLGRGSLTL